MARRKSGPVESHRREAWAVALFCLATVLLLSLVSYDPDENRFLKTPPDAATNWAGPMGVYIGGAALFLFGAGAYLLPLLGYAGCGLALWAREFKVWRFLLLGGVIVVSGAGLLDSPVQFLDEWRSEKGLQSPGGFVAEFLKETFPRPFIGPVVTVLLLGAAYFVALMLLFRIRPLRLAREFGPWLMERIYRWQIARADAARRIEIERKRLEREARRLEREMRRSGVVPKPGRPAPGAGADGEELEEERERTVPDRPEPRIIDTAEAGAAGAAEASGRDDRVRAARPVRPPKAAPVAAAPAPDFSAYELPPLGLLRASGPAGRPVANKQELELNRARLIETLADFGIETDPGDITRGATITRYEIYPKPGVRVDRIVNLNKDIARAMRAESVNILAPVPGKDSVAVDIPNTNKMPVTLRDLFETENWTASTGRIPLALGKDIYGSAMVADLGDMPHLLIAGTTGSGKSVCINAILMSLLYRFRPDELRMVLVDPKVVELQAYNGLPHLVVPVVTDPKKVLVALRWVIAEMEKRYEIMARAGVRTITAFNARNRADEGGVETLDLAEKLESAGDNGDNGDNGEEPEEAPPSAPTPTAEPPMPDRLPYIVVLIDELADLMQTAPKDVEIAIARLSAKARAAGIHLVIATQTPRASVITGVIKTNIPSRVAFQVPSALDSRVILDSGGAENLLGKGDLLFLPPGSAKLVRAQGAFISDEEVSAVVGHIRKRSPAFYDTGIHQRLSAPAGAEEDGAEEDEELIAQCVEVVRQERKASTSLLQRRLRLGYTRAARMIDILERRGIVGPENGAKPREVYTDME